jgi:hypothetical protein
MVAGNLVPTMEDGTWVNMAKGGLGTFKGLGAHLYAHGTPSEHKVSYSTVSFSSLIILSPKSPLS